MKKLFIEGLNDAQALEFAEMLATLEQKTARNQLKNVYYDMKNRLKDMGISIPPQLQKFQSVVGWPKKAVDALANRSIFEGFVHEDEETNQKLNLICEQNRFDLLTRQATRSELVNSCVFLTVSAGDVNDDEPQAIVSAYSAENATGIWDSRNKRLKAGLTVVARGKVESKDKQPTHVYYYTDDSVFELVNKGGWKVKNIHEHKMGRPLIELLAFDPTIDRPFGRSRITRAVISIADSAMRASLRAEVASEFFTAPQRYILGADEDMFSDKSVVEAYTGYMLAITGGEDGETPKVGQFDPMSMAPHTEYIRSLAVRFAGETSLPVSALGVVQDNPASAEAIYASKEDIIIEAQNLNASNAPALKNIGFMILAIIEGKSFYEVSTEHGSKITVKYKSPAMPSVVSQSDAMVKQVAAIPWIAETRVALEELGYSDEQITRMLVEKKKNTGIATIRELAEAENVYIEE